MSLYKRPLVPSTSKTPVGVTEFEILKSSHKWVQHLCTPLVRSIDMYDQYLQVSSRRRRTTSFMGWSACRKILCKSLQRVYSVWSEALQVWKCKHFPFNFRSRCWLNFSSLFDGVQKTKFCLALVKRHVATRVVNIIILILAPRDSTSTLRVLVKYH